MINKYIIFERYEYWGKNGKTFTEWFRAPIPEFYDDEKSAKEKIKEIKSNFGEMNKITKCKHEYEAKLIDCETLPIPKIKYSKKGRPSKEDIEKRQFEHDNYWKIYFGIIDKPE